MVIKDPTAIKSTYVRFWVENAIGSSEKSVIFEIDSAENGQFNNGIEKVGLKKCFLKYFN